MISPSPSHGAGFALLLGLFAITSLIFTFTLIQFVQQTSGGRGSPSPLRLTRVQDDHTYVDDDFPARLPNFEPGDVQIAVEESVRFSLWDPEGPEEWSSVLPPGEGSVRLGPDGRVFYLSMFHELHCLRQLQKLFRDPLEAARPPVLVHAQHCLNFLRQWSLCQADRTLEVGDFITRNFTTDRAGVVHTCKDWKVVYDRVTYDWSNWKDAASRAASDQFQRPTVPRA